MILLIVLVYIGGFITAIYLASEIIWSLQTKREKNAEE